MTVAGKSLYIWTESINGFLFSQMVTKLMTRRIVASTWMIAKTFPTRKAESWSMSLITPSTRIYFWHRKSRELSNPTRYISKASVICESACYKGFCRSNFEALASLSMSAQPIGTNLWSFGCLYLAISVWAGYTPWHEKLLYVADTLVVDSQ